MASTVQEIIGKEIPRVISAIADFEQDRTKFPLFHLSSENNNDFHKIDFDNRILSFFALILSCKQYGNRFEDELNPPDYDEFLNCFIGDIKMSLLEDSLINIGNYYRVNKFKPSDKQSNIKNELFLDFNTFESQLEEFFIHTDFLETEEIFKKVSVHQNDIHLKVPRICFPWFANALSHSYKRFPKWVNGYKFSMKLRWTRSEFPNERELIEKAQKSFNLFIKSLKGNDAKQSKNINNRSLNLHLFNAATNLYDIYNIVNRVHGDLIVKYQTFELGNDIKIKRRIKSNKVEKEERYHWKWSILKGVSHIASINTFGVKTLLVNEYYNEELFTDERIWDTFKKVFNHCKSYILEVLTNQCLSKYGDVANELRLDYCVYREFFEEEPYEKFIKDVLEKGLDIYSPSEDEMETHLYEAYYYAYKNFYEQKSKRDESIK